MKHSSSEVEEDVDIDSPPSSPKKQARSSKAKQVGDEGEKEPKTQPFDPAEIALLAAQPTVLPVGRNPHADDVLPPGSILELKAASVTDQGPIVGMKLSYNEELLATFGALGHIKIWDTDSWQPVQQLRDRQEENIDEFFCGAFLPDGRHLLAAGKLKDRKRWSAQDEDNHILPCPVKLFDLITGDVLQTFHGHEEEILFLELCRFKGKSYMVTSSQDGYIIKWEMSDDFRQVRSLLRVKDGRTCMAFMVAFLPNTGNRYFLAACDEYVRLYDFEHAEMLQTFDVKFSSYCDFVSFVQPRHMPTDPATAYFVTRGVELLGEDSEDAKGKTPPTIREEYLEAFIFFL